MKKIEELIKTPLEALNLFVYSIEYKDKCLNIVLDSEEIIDLDKIVEATHVINKILDEKDFIKESYTLDVSSKEKGEEK